MGAIISTVNWADSATIAASGGYTILRTLDDVKKPWGRGLARGHIADMPVMSFTVDLGAVRTVRTIGVRGVNGTSCDMSVSASATSSSGDEVLSAESTGFSEEWGFPFGSGLWLHADTSWSIRYLTISVEAFADSSPTFVDLRRLWIGDGVTLSEGVDEGWSLDFVDSSLVERSTAGGVFSTVGQQWRRVQAGLVNRPSSAILGDGAAWARLSSVGRGREVVVALRRNWQMGDSGRMSYLQTVHGQLAEWRPMTNAAGELYGIDGFTVEEAPMPRLS